MVSELTIQGHHELRTYFVLGGTYLFTVGGIVGPLGALGKLCDPRYLPFAVFVAFHNNGILSQKVSQVLLCIEKQRANN